MKQTKDDILYALELCKLAYNDVEDMKLIDKTMSIPKEQWWHYANADGFFRLYESCGETAIDIVDRGTDTPDDWRHDFDFAPFEVPDGDGGKYDIHSGILEIHIQRRDFIFNLIKKFSPKRMRFTGHSLGGGTAQVCALDVKENCKDIDCTVIAFASPRPFDKYSAEKVMRVIDDVYGYALRPDPVYMLPPQNTPLSSIKILEPVEWWSVFADNPLGQLYNINFNRAGHPHHPQRLREAIIKHVQ